MPATYADVDAVVADLPEVTEGLRYGNRTWLVAGKAFAGASRFSGV